MLKSKYVWNEVGESYEPQQSEYHPKIEELLVSRNLATPDTINDFIHGLKEGFDPFLFKDMEKVVERIHLAVDLQEPILIYGDYDADGVTSVAILVRCIQELGGRVDYYIPNRFTEGYGPNAKAFEKAVADGYQLVITVDNGISGIEEAKIFAKAGIDYIITDHHHAKAELPEAFAIIHPELEEAYPWSYLSGSGVALKVAQALLDGEVPEMYYTISMLGTVGDVVSLQSENRYIVKRGLEELKGTEVPGLVALMEVAGTKGTIDEVTVGFEICPRLNAPGRMADAEIAAALLITDDYREAHEYAVQIDAFNSERKAVGKQIEAEALALAAQKSPEQLVYVLYQEGWHEGILGIVAGKLSKQLGKAILMLTRDKFGQAKGSARAIEGFHLFDLLSGAGNLVEKFGGHELAAGLTVELSNIEALEQNLNEQMAGKVILPRLGVDLALSLSEANMELINQFSALAPFGEGNRRPLVKLGGVLAKNVKAIGNKLQHLKFTLTDGRSDLDAIAFGLGDKAIYFTAGTVFDVVGELSINEFNGKRAVQLLVSDMKSDSDQVLDLRNRQLFEAHKSKFLGSPTLGASKVGDGLADSENLVVDELPESVEAVKQVIRDRGARNVVLFPYAPVTFAGRDKFVKFFGILKKHPQFELTEQTYGFFSGQELSKNEVNFILRVFFENEIVIINKGVVSLRPDAGKKALTDSPTYCSQEAKSKMYEFFELSSEQDLRQILF